RQRHPGSYRRVRRREPRRHRHVQERLHGESDTGGTVKDPLFIGSLEGGASSPPCSRSKRRFVVWRQGADEAAPSKWIRRTLAASSVATCFAAPVVAADVPFAPHVDVQVAVHPAAIASADLNSDGRADVITVHAETDELRILLSRADGTFAVSTPVLA